MNQLFFRLKIVWAAMLAGVGLYIVITLLFVTKTGPLIELGAERAAAFELAMMIVAIFNVAIILYINKTMKQPEKIGARLAADTSARASDMTTDEKMAALMPYYFQLCVLRWAMAEGVAMFGLVLSFVSGPIATVGIIYMVSAALLLQFQAKPGELREMARMIG